MGIEAKETSKSPFGIVLVYILFGAAWIIFSDMAVALLIHDPIAEGVVATVKGWAFVAVTAALLHLLIDRKMKAIAAADGRRQEAERLRAVELEEREIAVGFLRLVNESRSREEMIRETVTFFQRQSGCEAVGIRLKEGDDYPYFEARGFSSEFVQAENQLCLRDGGDSPGSDSDGSPVLACMCGNVIRGRFDPAKPFFTARGSFWTNCTTELLAGSSEAERLTRTRNRCNGEGYESVALIALAVGEERLGLLQLNDRRKGRFSGEAIALWERLAGYLAVAVAKFQAEEALLKSARQYRLLFENMLEGFAHCRMIFDENGRPIDFVYLDVNGSFGRLTGLANVVGKRVSEAIPGTREAHPELLEIYGRVALTGRPEKFETEFKPLGAWFAVSVYSTEREYFIAVFENITERKDAEARLHRERSFLKTLVRTIPDLVWLKDPDGVYLACNPTFERFFGASEADIVGKTDYDFVSAAEADFFRGKDREAMAAGRARVNEEWITFADDGHRALLETIKTPMADAEGGLIGVLGVARDITAIYRAQQEREKADRLESLGLLAGGIAHDFNNILTAAVGNISLARLQIGEEHRLDERLAACEKALGRAAELTRQLVTFARGGEPVKGAVATERLIREVVSFALRGSNSKGDLVLPDGLWPLDADAGQIHQALNNLIINACQAMPDGGTLTVGAGNVTLGSGDEESLPAGRYLRIAVSDQGCGIAPEVIGKIFDPYFTTKATGTGLGLASAFSIVKRHGGVIRASSAPGQGATFTMLLPAADDISDTEKGGPEEPGRLTAKAPERAVLVMDDEEMIRILAAAILVELGYSAITCDDGAEAVSLYRSHLENGEPFAAVILDMTVPGGMGGREAALRINALDPHAVLIISSGYSVDSVSAGKTNPIFRGVVAKPYNVSQLAQELDRLIQA